MHTILGLDISTSITGATVIRDGKILETVFWDTRNKRKFPTFYEKAEFIKEKINNHEVFYNHFLDQTDPNKWNNNYKLKPINVGELPDYISKNKNQFSDWFSKN